MFNTSSPSAADADGLGIILRRLPGPCVMLGLAATVTARLGVAAKRRKAPRRHPRRMSRPRRAGPRSAADSDAASSSMEDCSAEHWRLKGYGEGDHLEGPGFHSKAGDALRQRADIPEHVKVPFPSPMIESIGTEVPTARVESVRRWEPTSVGPRFRTLPPPVDAPFLRHRGAGQLALRSRVNTSSMDDVRTSTDVAGVRPLMPEAEIDIMCQNFVPKQHFRAVRPDQRNRATQVSLGRQSFRRELEQRSLLFAKEAEEVRELWPIVKEKQKVETHRGPGGPTGEKKPGAPPKQMQGEAHRGPPGKERLGALEKPEKERQGSMNRPERVYSEQPQVRERWTGTPPQRVDAPRSDYFAIGKKSHSQSGPPPSDYGSRTRNGSRQRQPRLTARRQNVNGSRDPLSPPSPPQTASLEEDA
eukprot:CAMPEP_0178412826 /NCGR_PEP_ID=MMETSP0689_2-20121128/22215_1 /TAXON_ID=160604 /ORGANISM="Amphidinium massartii, Strain CS-259" /LENGTH=416 /DNA_ID=CAMNT_0020034085 /DNA_START=182 /DNA_END=1429 /DNA_ORIENTATION=-